MTVSTTAAQVTALGNGTTLIFNFSFEIPYQSDGVTPAIYVFLVESGVIVPQTLGSNYTVSGAEVGTGGSITFTTAPPSGSLVVIRRALQNVQPNSFPNFSLEPSQIEAALDFLTFWMQQFSVAALQPPGPYTVATLPTNPLPGQWAWVTDLLTHTWGATAVGGGSITSQLFYNGTAWIVSA